MIKFSTKIYQNDLYFTRIFRGHELQTKFFFFLRYITWPRNIIFLSVFLDFLAMEYFFPFVFTELQFVDTN